MYEIANVLMGRVVFEGMVRVGFRRLIWVVRSWGVWERGWVVEEVVNLVVEDEVRYVVWFMIVPWRIVLRICESRMEKSGRGRSRNRLSLLEGEEYMGYRADCMKELSNGEDI